MKHWYKNLEHRYQNFDKPIQLINLISDLKKALNLVCADAIVSKNHLYRAIILVDYMIDDPKWRSGLKELLRLREVIGSHIAGCPIGTLEQLVDVVLSLNADVYKKLKVQRVPGRSV